MRIEVLGAPVDLGADRRGVDMGPSAIRYAGLLSKVAALDCEVADRGNLPLLLPGGVDAGPASAKYLAPIVAMCRDVRDSVREIVAAGSFPLVLGGDHSVSLGSISGLVNDGRLGVVWMDAHGDFNTPDTTPSGNVHGMVLSALTGYGETSMISLSGRVPAVLPECVSLVCVRELDPAERDLLRGSGVHVFTIADVDREGMAAITTKAIAAIAGSIDSIHLSLDMDVVDPQTAPGVGTPVPGGLSYREAQIAMETVGASGLLRSMDVVEVNPILDQSNQTAALAVDLVLSALGKRIL